MKNIRFLLLLCFVPALLHQWNGTDGYWDGNIDGKPASDGVYYVILEYTFCSGADETKTYKGFVHLMR